MELINYYGLEDFISLILAIFPQTSYRIQSSPYQNSSDLFCRNGKANPQIHMELQGTLNSQNNTEKENQSWKTHTSQF